MNGKRKEVTLDIQTVAVLQAKAESEGRKLKNYMEFVLREKAQELELSPAYKQMMDEMIAKHAQGDLKYTNWDTVKKNLKA